MSSNTVVKIARQQNWKQQKEMKMHNLKKYYETNQVGEPILVAFDSHSYNKSAGKFKELIKVLKTDFPKLEQSEIFLSVWVNSTRYKNMPCVFARIPDIIPEEHGYERYEGILQGTI